MFQWLRRLLGTNKRGPYQKRTGEDQLKKQEARYFNHLFKTDKARFQEVMERRLGVSGSASNPLQEFLKMRKELAAAGLIPKAEAGDALDRLVDKLPDIAAGVVGVTTAMAQRNQQPTRQQQVIEHEPITPVQNAPAPTDAAPTEPQAQPEPEENVEVSAIVTFVQSQLDGKEPEDAAKWIVGQWHPAAKAMVQKICATPDDTLFAELDGMAKDYPEWQPLMAWLRERGWWTLQVARHIRAIADGKPAKQPRKKPASL